MSHVACIRDVRNTRKIFVGNQEGKRPPKRPARKYKDNIKMDMKH